MHSMIEEIYRTAAVEGQSGRVHSLHSSLDPEEGKFLTELIAHDLSIRRTLEIGCAFGLSALFICDAIAGREDASHKAIDPFQFTQWDGVGAQNVKRAGFNFFSLILDKSELALPALLREGEGCYDLILLDGFHTFDQTLLDCFYATRLLRVGGYLVIDDLIMPAVRRAVRYVQNYSCFTSAGRVAEPLRLTPRRRIGRLLLSPIPDRIKQSIFAISVQDKLYQNATIRMLAFKKIAEDDRP